MFYYSLPGKKLNAVGKTLIKQLSNMFNCSVALADSKLESDSGVKNTVMDV